VVHCDLPPTARPEATAETSVLLVNDDPVYLAALAAELAPSGYRFLTAHNGADAFALALETRPDIIVSDVSMPRLDGIELCRRVRHDPHLRDTPVVLMTAVRCDTASAVEGLQAGADDYLELPYDPMRLVAKLAGLAERRRRERAVRNQNRAERALRHSEARFRALVEHNADAIVVLTADGIIEFASESIERLTGVPAHLWIGRSAFERMDDESRAAMQKMIAQSLETPERTFVVDYRSRRADGSWRTREAAVANRLAHPAVRGIVVTFRDTTERIKAEHDLRAATAKLQAIVSSLPIALWAIDRHGVITLSEGQLLDRLGHAPGALVGRSVFDLYGNFPDVLAVIGRVLAGESPAVTIEVEGLTFESRYVPIRAADGTVSGAISVALDVSDRVALEAQLRQAQKMEAVGQLAAGVAHDFNNMLTVMIGFTELAAARLSDGDPIGQDLSEVLNAARSATSLTRQLLAFSRKQILQPQVLDANATVVRMENFLRRSIGDDITLVTSLAPSLGRVHADPGQLEQVIMNLAVNARDAMPHGGTLTIATANGQFDDARACVTLSITDTGTGMDPAVKARVFEPFYTTKEHGKGTGLGLATVYGIVAQSGGAIAIDSEVGRGTVVRVSLPRAEPTAEPMSADAVATRGGSETILLVEDQPGLRAVARAALARHGYTVLEAGDAAEALRAAAAHPEGLDLLLTDVVMPGMSGRELAQEIVRRWPASRVLYMSGYGDDLLAPHGVLDAGVALLQKPFTPRQLLQKVRLALD
jgi:two-component system cell cycle sensor histidine kinase/response regulator CckA